MKLALLGTRGIPARYGGFETFAEELSARLAARGHDITVYCRRRHAESQYRGVTLRYIPALRHKYFETVAHTFVCTLDLLFRRPDAALYCNAANAIFTWIPRPFGVAIVLNVDGLERKRKKWNLLAKAWYLAGEWLATFCPNAIVSDANEIAEYYRRRYGKQTEFIPYGAETGKVTGTSALERLGLEPGRYFLYVSRMEPENNALLVRQAFERVNTDLKLALIGDAPYAKEYIEKVRDTRDPRVIIPGAIYGEEYHQLQSHSFAYIQATEVGGTHPALIEAMGRGALVLYLETPENTEVAGDVAIPFERDGLTGRIEEALAMPCAAREEMRNRAAARIAERYSWEAVTGAYEKLLRGIAGRSA